MRKLIISLFVACGMLSASASTCSFSGTLSSAGNSPNFDNRTLACNQFTLSYTTTSVTGILISLQGAPDNSGSPGTFTDLISATDANPGSTVPSDIMQFSSVGVQWLRIHLYTITGTSVAFSLTGIGPSPQVQPMNVYTSTVSGLSLLVAKTQMALIVDGASGTDCSTGHGSAMVVCVYNGSTWQTATAGVTTIAGDGLVDSSTPQSGAATLTPLTQAAHAVLIGPASGGPSTPTFRTLQVSDLPGGTNITSSAFSPVSTNCFSSDGASYNESWFTATCAQATTVQTIPSISFTFPANTFTATSQFVLMIPFQCSSGATTVTETFTLYLGGTQVYAPSAPGSALPCFTSSTNLLNAWSFMISGTGAPGASVPVVVSPLTYINGSSSNSLQNSIVKTNLATNGSLTLTAKILFGGASAGSSLLYPGYTLFQLTQ